MTDRNEKASRERTCVGCGGHDVREAFVRLVLAPSDTAPGAMAVVADLGGSSFGRGAHVHAKRDCLEKACKAGLSRSFKMRVTTTAADLVSQMIVGAERRIQGLILSAKRTGGVAIGADATCAAADEGAKVIIVAKDAGTILNRGAIQRAVAEGRVVVWGDKDRLGALLGGATVAVMAVTYRPIADSILGANALVQSLAADAVGGGT